MGFLSTEKATGFSIGTSLIGIRKTFGARNTTFGMTKHGAYLPYTTTNVGVFLGSPSDVAIDGPITKMIRNGLQDWALFRMADKAGMTAMVQTQLSAVYHQFGACTYSGCTPPPGGFFWEEWTRPP